MKWGSDERPESLKRVLTAGHTCIALSCGMCPLAECAIPVFHTGLLNLLGEAPKRCCEIMHDLKYTTFYNDLSMCSILSVTSCREKCCKLPHLFSNLSSLLLLGGPQNITLGKKKTNNSTDLGR